MRHISYYPSRAFWLKGLGILLLVLAVCTVLSRIAASFTVAKVTVANPAQRSIEHTVMASGRIEKDRELAVVTQPDILVKRVLVKEGQSVKKGTALLKLDLNSLGDQIDGLTRQIRSLDVAVSRAQEDYNRTVSRNQRAVDSAAAKLKDAKDTLATWKNSEHIQINAAGTGDTTEEDELAQLQADVMEKQEAYDAACDAQWEENTAAKRALEDAQGELTGNLSEQLQRLNHIKESDGYIRAPMGGVITGILAEVGQKTTDTAAVTMTDKRAGLRFVAQIDKEDAAYVSVGDPVTLEGSGKTVEDVSVDTIEADEDGETLTVTVRLPYDSLSLGQSADMTVSRNSEKYPCTVPITALFQENNKTFLYLINTKDTVLGKQNVAQKMEVKVLDKNDVYAALDQSALSTDSEVIVDMDRYVEAGDEVRLSEE